MFVTDCSTQPRYSHMISLMTRSDRRGRKKQGKLRLWLALSVRCYHSCFSGWTNAKARSVLLHPAQRYPSRSNRAGHALLAKRFWQKSQQDEKTSDTRWSGFEENQQQLLWPWECGRRTRKQNETKRGTHRNAVSFVDDTDVVNAVSESGRPIHWWPQRWLVSEGNFYVLLRYGAAM